MNTNYLQTPCSWLCPDCDIPNFSPTLLDLSSNALNLSNSFDIPSDSVAGTRNNSSRSNSAMSSSKRNMKTKLKGMIINCNGLKSSKHSTEFQALLEKHDPNIVLGTESKLNPGIPSYSIFPSSYSVLRKDRNAFGGGVFHAIKSDLACIEESNFNVDDCEVLWSSLRIANRKTLYISSFYRPPNSSTEILDHLSESLNNVFTSVPNHPNIIMGGDFNLGDIDWSQEIPSTTNPATASQHNKFMHILDDYSLSQHVKVQTRPASGKTLDLLPPTYPNSVSNASTSSGLSDHLAVTFEINLKPHRSTKPPHKVYVYKKANFGGLNDFISKSSSECFASNLWGNSVEQNWNSFKHAVTSGISQFIPQKSSLNCRLIPSVISHS